MLQIIEWIFYTNDKKFSVSLLDNSRRHELYDFCRTIRFKLYRRRHYEEITLFIGGSRDHTIVGWVLKPGRDGAQAGACPGARRKSRGESARRKGRRQ